MRGIRRFDHARQCKNSSAMASEKATAGALRQVPLFRQSLPLRDTRVPLGKQQGVSFLYAKDASTNSLKPWSAAHTTSRFGCSSTSVHELHENGSIKTGLFLIHPPPRLQYIQVCQRASVAAGNGDEQLLVACQHCVSCVTTRPRKEHGQRCAQLQQG